MNTDLCPSLNLSFSLFVFLPRKVEPRAELFPFLPCLPPLELALSIRAIKGFVFSYAYRAIHPRGGDVPKRPNSTRFQTLKMVTGLVFSLQAVEILNYLDLLFRV